MTSKKQKSPTVNVKDLADAAEKLNSPTDPTPPVAGDETTNQPVTAPAVEPVATPTDSVKEPSILDDLIDEGASDDEGDVGTVEELIDEVVAKVVEIMQPMIADMVAESTGKAKKETPDMMNQITPMDILKKHGLLVSSILSPESIHALKLSDEEKKVLLDNLPKTLSDMKVAMEFSDLPDYIQEYVKCFGLIMSKLTDNDYLTKALTIESVDEKGEKTATFYEKEKYAISRYVAHYMTETMKNSGIKLSNSQIQDIRNSFTKD